jgi:peptide/nickel transport system ATP-binding protein
MFVTHDMSVVKHISDDIAVMYLGQIVERSPAKDLFKRQFHPYTRALISAIPKIDSSGRGEDIILHGEIGSPVEPKPGCRFAPRCQYVQEGCTKADPVLKEIESHRFVACWRAGEV